MVGKNLNRQDKYGNYLLSDEAFNIGVKAMKNYIDSFREEAEMIKGRTPHQFLKRSNIYVDALIEVSSEAITDANLNPNFDITNTDFSEMIEKATNEKIDLSKRTTGAAWECWG